MTPEKWAQVERFYHAAVELDASARRAFLVQACGDEALRHEVESLLVAHDEAGSLIAAPALEVAAQELAHDRAGSPLREALTVPLGGTARTIGHFQILSLLGRGGMGEVYLAEDSRLGRKVALKLLPAEFTADADRLRRFTHEAKAASALNHPNILTVHEIGVADGAHYIVTEFIDGQTLRQRMHVAKPGLTETVEITLQIAKALEAAHAAGIIHRDIKPENVMVRADGLVKVLDFGLAKLTEPVANAEKEAMTLKKANTASGMVLGTPRYMSPEQARGEELDARTDLFSFGAMLYEMTTGEPPFKGASLAVIFDAILHSEPVPPTRLNSKLPVELERIIGKALEKDRELRYQSAMEMLADLKRLQRDVSSGRAAVQVVAPSVANPSVPWLKWAVAVAVTVVVAAFLIWQLKPAPGESLKVVGYSPITTDGGAKASGVWDQPLQALRLSLVTDGARLYFPTMVNGNVALNQVSGAGGETVTLPVPFHNANLLDISPNRSDLLVANYVGSEFEAPLWVLPVLGGSARRLGDLQGHAATWLPNGRQLVFANDNDLFVANHDGGETRKLLTAQGRVYWPRWSPDGKRLRFTVLDLQSNAISLWEASADGSNLHPLLPDWNTPATECCGNWTPDGKHFIFQSTRNQLVSLWALNEEPGSAPVQLTSGPLNFRAPVPSADGRKLFAVGEQRRGELMRYDKRAEQWVSYRFGETVPSAHLVNFSNDGQWIAYTTYPDGNLWRSRADGSERLQLSFPPMRVHSPRWSPDGKQIAFNALLPGKPWKIYLISANGGAPQPLMPEERAERDPIWSPDGNTMFFAVGAAGTADKRTIHLLDLRSNQVSLVPGSEGKYSPRLSPHGRYLSALTISAQKLLLFDFTTQKWTELANMNVSYPQWSKDGKYIYFVNQLRSDPPLLRLRISDRKIEQWASLKGMRIAPSFFGRWMGLTPDDAPMVLRDVGVQDIYALEWNVR